MNQTSQKSKQSESWSRGLQLRQQSAATYKVYSPSILMYASDINMSIVLLLDLPYLVKKL